MNVNRKLYTFCSLVSFPVTCLPLTRSASAIAEPLVTVVWHSLHQFLYLHCLEYLTAASCIDVVVYSGDWVYCQWTWWHVWVWASWHSVCERQRWHEYISACSQERRCDLELNDLLLQWRVIRLVMSSLFSSLSSHLLRIEVTWVCVVCRWYGCMLACLLKPAADFTSAGVVIERTTYERVYRVIFAVWRQIQTVK